MNKKRIDIVIPTYNNSGLIVNLLRSIEKQIYNEYNCFVIDDNSKDTTVKIIKENFPWVNLIQQHKNNGPSKNRNIAIQAGTSPYIVMFDDDVYLSDQDWLSKAVKIMDNNANIGQLASMIVSGFDEDILVDCGNYGEGPFFGGIYNNRNKKDVLGKHMISRRVLGACTAGTIIRREIFEKIGGFDPKYYYLAEDIDLSLRVHLSGYDIVYNPSLITHHYESQAIGKKAGLKKYLYHRNNLFLLIQNYPIGHVVKKIGVFVFRAIARSILDFLRIFLAARKTTVLEDIRNYIKLCFFLLFNIPHICVKRLKFYGYSKRPRQYLIDINRQLCEDISLKLPVKSIIYSVTDRCNAKCKMCFQYEDLNKEARLLSLDEIRRLSQSLDELNNIVLGGGEPFLRDDIDQLCNIFIKNNNPSITIPTNGSLPEIIYEKTKRIMGYGCTYLIISLSLDGVEDYHDKNRGIPGLFNKVQECYEKLIRLRRIYGDRLQIQVNTCVSKGNLDQLDALSGYLTENMPEASWLIEPVRGTFNKEMTTPLSDSDWENLYKNLDKFNKDRILPDELKKIYEYSIATLNKKTQVLPCSAGDEFISIDPAGNIYPCELLPSVTNIRDIDYDINRLKANPKWNDALNDIKQKKCYCTHFCWLMYGLSKQDNIQNRLSSVRTLVRKLSNHF